jgi:hypothetical protein
MTASGGLVNASLILFAKIAVRVAYAGRSFVMAMMKSTSAVAPR